MITGAAVKKDQPILIMAGGTGGHVFPALAVALRLREQGQNIVWMGTHQGIEADVVPAAGIEMEWISVTGLRGQGKLALLFAPFRLLKACWQAWRILRRRRPSVVLGMGGFVSGPGGLMSWMLRTPLLIHEQNAVVGLTNGLLARLATQTIEAFPGAFPRSHQALCLGNPLRAEVMGVPLPEVRFFGRDPSVRRLLIVGGSQGALVFNRDLPELLAKVTLAAGCRLDVRHQSGVRGVEVAKQAYSTTDLAVTVVPFMDNMAEQYAWADLVICRAGAMTVAELAAVGVASVLVPLPSAVDDHQTLNAHYLSDAGAALRVAQQDLLAGVFAEHLQGLLEQPKPLLQMAVQARRLAKLDATDKVAELCLAQRRES
ncbi:MAG: undecaprenyldiphospho-muramoylpentapeptide beta-N-acetylglucosaminyltransferase [Gammaproteobacteria bacterium]|nr:undecaprenyldiphospho-muramoylpentapeptide beta-N-acetylglucosaminyltransferase [Gammaproteobacteria bacterium]